MPGHQRTMPRKPTSSDHNNHPRKAHRNNINKEIYYYQKSNQVLFPRLPFARVIRQIIMDRQQQRSAAEQQNYRISVDALDALQWSTENFLVDLFANGVLLAEHAKRVTVMDRDIRLVLRIRKSILIVAEK